MRNSFDDLCDKILIYWPKKINVKERIIHKNGGMRFPGLITVHDEIQKKLFKKKNDLLWVMDWAIYKFLHESAKHSNIIYPHDINREYLQQVFEEDLSYPDEELSDARKKYKNLLHSNSFNKTIAERGLLYSSKGSDIKKELRIRIGVPYWTDDGQGKCPIQWRGFSGMKETDTSGSDLLQALHMAVDINSLLKKFQSEYDFYRPTGEPYFDD